MTDHTNATPDRAANHAEKIVREFTDVWLCDGNPERGARAIVMALHHAGLIEGEIPDDWAGPVIVLGRRDA